jgi:2-amino-4-hydroxy-6-hydroxymethyldihydropteridine diphosphokinase
MDSEQHALVAFGGNLFHNGKPPKDIILAAIAELSRVGLTLRRQSRLYETPCFPAGAGPDYVNAAACVTLRHNQTAVEVLDCLHRIEARFGRERQRRWGTRTLDVDLLAIGDLVLPNREIFLHWRDLPIESQSRETPSELILPHPRLQDRAFVLVPLADVAPDWRHPVSGLTVLQMLAALPEAARAEIRPL